MVNATLDVAPWMNIHAVQALFSALGAPETDVRFVGGCVRDSILSRQIKDIDVATPDEPGSVVEKLSAAGIKVVPTGLAHGTVTAIVDGQAFEITSLRKDTACDGRHADVQFTTDWVEDASRRDFTFNALSMRQDGTLFDPFGGVADAKAGRVLFVGDPGDRIQEDYLRILRYFRFLALYGKHDPDRGILEVCAMHQEGLASLSIERVRDEFVKLLSAPDPTQSLMAMEESGALKAVAKDTQIDLRLDLLINAEKALAWGSGGVGWIRRWVFLFGQSATDIAQRIKISRKNALKIQDCSAAAVAAATVAGLVDLNRFLYAFANGSEPRNEAVEGVVIACARAENAKTNDWASLLHKAQMWVRVRFPLTGADVQALGVSEGPEIGTLLKAVEQEWVDGGFNASREDLRARLNALVK